MPATRTNYSTTPVRIDNELALMIRAIARHSEGEMTPSQVLAIVARTQIVTEFEKLPKATRLRVLSKLPRNLQ